MSEEKKDRFNRIDKAGDKVREELDEAVDDSKELGGVARPEIARSGVYHLDRALRRAAP